MMEKGGRKIKGSKAVESWAGQNKELVLDAGVQWQLAERSEEWWRVDRVVRG